VVGGIAAVVLALAIAWVLLVPAADWLARHDVGSAHGQLLQAARDAARGRLLTLGAGIFAAGALLYTARNFRLSREGQVTDRYTKAVEQLGSDKLDVRIGGIYALGRIAWDSVRDHPTVMDVLAALIRERSHEQWPLAEQGDATSAQQPPADPPRVTFPRSPRPDIQAALTVIGRRNRKNDRQRIDLHGADLAGADLTRGYLAEAILIGADLNHARLAAADLRGANLAATNLTSALLEDANLTSADLNTANLSGAILVNADLTGAYLGNANLSDTVLFGVNLRGANLSGALWPADTAVPKSFELDTDSGRLHLTWDSAPKPAKDN
jgi:hypothetical protein